MNNKTLTLAILIISSHSVLAQAPPWAWATGMGGVDEDQANGMVMDVDDNRYIVGTTDSDTLQFGSYILPLDDHLSTDLFLCKYGQDDMVQWALGVKDISSWPWPSIQFNANGQLTITGSTFADTVFFGDGITLVEPQGGGFAWWNFRATYDVDGNILDAQDVTYDTYRETKRVRDADGNSYAIGWFSQPSITFGSTTLMNEGARDGFLVKFDTLDNVLWAIQVGGGGWDYVVDIAVDEMGDHVVIVGSFDGASLEIGSAILTNSGAGTDGFIARIASNGSLH